MQKEKKVMQPVTRSNSKCTLLHKMQLIWRDDCFGPAWRKGWSSVSVEEETLALLGN